jgi:protein tyrosine phosphatase
LFSCSLVLFSRSFIVVDVSGCTQECILQGSVKECLVSSLMTLESEWKSLQRYERHLLSVKSRSIGMNRSNRSANRYTDVIPYDDSIVKLSTGEYINASWIEHESATSGSRSGSKPDWIATQGPLRKDRFREDLCEVVNIIMLTEVAEDGREKCYPYVEELSNVVGVAERKHVLGDSDNVVEVREYDLGDGKILRHVWVRHWPDFGIPQKEKGRELELKFDDNNVIAVKYLSDVDVGKRVCNIVHCSAGVGRSGTFLSLAWSYDGRDDIYESVRLMRERRPMMVQRFEQYMYLNTEVKRIKSGLL